jgi:hypothetical protein
MSPLLAPLTKFEAAALVVELDHECALVATADDLPGRDDWYHELADLRADAREQMITKFFEA